MKKVIFVTASVILVALIALILFMPNSLSKIFAKEEKPVDTPTIKIDSSVSSVKNEKSSLGDM